jgi:uncharacterized oxidoreductase
MNLQNNTILITGASSGIGYELARVLHANNKILICGRSMEKLLAAKKSLPEVHIFSCDLSLQADRLKLVQWIKENHPDCNVLINNAALVHKADFFDDEDMIAKAELEMQTNFMAPLALTKLLLPVLVRNQNAHVINITTGLIYAPRIIYPVYNATKAALHAFTRVLRAQLKNLPVRVVEVMMTVVDTPWHNGEAPRIAISPEQAVSEMLSSLVRDKEEIRIGRVKLLYVLSRIFPGFAFRKINNL